MLNYNVPEFYYAAFANRSETDSVRTGEVKNLWINSKPLKPTWTNITVASLFERLKSSDPLTNDAELMAERLSDLTRNHSAVIEKISKGLTLDRGELLGLSFLVLTLLARAKSPTHRRTHAPLDPDEFTWDKFESTVSDAKIQSKRTRASLEVTDGDLLDHGMHFVLNRTPNPFITSDRAMVVDSWIPQEAERVLGPLGVLDSEVGGSAERVVVLPLSPQTVLLSSAYLKRGYPNAPYIECFDETVFELNLLAGYAAERLVVADRDKPFGAAEHMAQSLIQL